MTLRRNSISSYDYPEHLNPFSAEHDENKKNKYFTFGRHRASFKESAINAWNIITTPTRRHRSNSLSSKSRNSNHDPVTFPAWTPRAVRPASPSTSRTPTTGPTATQVKQNSGACSQSEEEEKRYIRQGAKPKKKRRAPLPPGSTPAIALQESKPSLASPLGVTSSTESFGEPEICLRKSPATTSLNEDVFKVCITYYSSVESAKTTPPAQEDEDPNIDGQLSGNSHQPVSPDKERDAYNELMDSATENVADSSETPTMSLKELINDIITAYPPEDDEDKSESDTIPNKELPALPIESTLHPKEGEANTTIITGHVNTDLTTPKMTCLESNVQVPPTKIEEESSGENVRTALQVKEDGCIDKNRKSEEMAVYKGNLIPLRIEEPNDKCDIIENSLLAISTSRSTNKVCLQESLETLEKKPTSNSKLPRFRIEDYINTLSSKINNRTSSDLTMPVSGETDEHHSTDHIQTGSVTEGVLPTAEQNGCIANGFNNRVSSMKTAVKTSSISNMPVSSDACEDYTKDNVRTGSLTEGVLITAEQNGCIANGSVDKDLDSEEDPIPVSPVPPPRIRPHPTPRSKRATLAKGENG